MMKGMPESAAPALRRSFVLAPGRRLVVALGRSMSSDRFGGTRLGGRRAESQRGCPETDLVAVREG